DWTIEEKEETKENFQNSDERGEIFECDSSIAEKIQQENKNLPQASHKIKGPGFSKAFVKMPSWVKCNEALIATETYKERYVRPLSNEVLSTRHSYSNAVTTRLNLKSYCDIDGNINLPDHKRVVCQIKSLHRITNNCKCNKKCKCRLSQYDLWLDEIVSIIAQAQGHLVGQSIEKLYKLIQEAKRIIPQKGKTFRLAPNKESILVELWDWAKQTSLLPFENRKSASLICHLRKDLQGIVRALKTEFPELRIKEYHGKSDPMEKTQDFSNVEESWKNIDLVTYTSTLKIGLLNAKRECLPRELQNRGIFPDDGRFFQKVGMVVSVIEFVPKPEDTMILLFQTVKMSSSIVKAEEISNIPNASIVNHETTELLENKPKKTLEETRSLDRHHIVDCYEIPPETLTEDFISRYGNYNHMKWFRAYRQLRDA
ncbi:4497_t:CDS:2, partial [Funneliformis geosporum]